MRLSFSDSFRRDRVGLILGVLVLLSSAWLSAAEIDCPECTGKGDIACSARCKDGKALCPDKCLKIEVGTWSPRGPDGKRWQEVGFGTRISDGHLGQICEFPNGKYALKDCPTCKRTTRVTCKRCQGKSRVACPACKGAKKIEAADYEKFKLDRLLAKGFKRYRITGTGEVWAKITAKMGTRCFVALDGGKSIEVEEGDIKELATEAEDKKPESPAVQAQP